MVMTVSLGQIELVVVEAAFILDEVFAFKADPGVSETDGEFGEAIVRILELEIGDTKADGVALKAKFEGTESVGVTSEINGGVEPVENDGKLEEANFRLASADPEDSAVEPGAKSTVEWSALPERTLRLGSTREGGFESVGSPAPTMCFNFRLPVQLADSLVVGEIQRVVKESAGDPFTTLEFLGPTEACARRRATRKTAKWTSIWMYIMRTTLRKTRLFPRNCFDNVCLRIKGF